MLAMQMRRDLGSEVWVEADHIRTIASHQSMCRSEVLGWHHAHLGWGIQARARLRMVVLLDSILVAKTGFNIRIIYIYI